MSDLSRRLRASQMLESHLGELKVFVGREVQPMELVPLEDTLELRKQAAAIARRPGVGLELPFTEKSSSRFSSYVRALIAASSLPVYVWTEASNLCGVLRPIPLASFNFDFPFDACKRGIVVLLTEDLKDQMLLDFSLSSDGHELIEVEVSGPHWSAVRY